MMKIIAKWPSQRGQAAKVRSSEGCEGMEFPWRWISGTIFTNLDVIWGMSVEPLDEPDPGHVLICCSRPTSNLVIEV